MPRIFAGRSEPQRVIGAPLTRRAEGGALRATLMSRLVAVSDLLRDTTSVESAAAAIGRAALSLTGAPRGAIFLRLASGVVTCPWSHNLSDEYIGRLCTPPGANPWAHLSHHPELSCMDLPARGRVRSAQPSIVEDVRDLPAGNEMRRAAEHEGVRALFSWPLSHKGRVFAAVAYYFDDAHACTDPEREVVLAFALQATTALEQAVAGEARGAAAKPAAEPDADNVAEEPAAESAAGATQEAAETDTGAATETEGGFATETDRLAALQRALEIEAGRLSAERTRLAVEREQLAGARRELDVEREQLATLRRTVDADQERLAEMQRMLEADGARLAEMRRTLEADSERQAAVRGELEADRKQLSGLRRELDAERTRLEGARRTLDAERAQVAGSRKELDTAGERLAEMRRGVDAGSERLAAARTELETERGRLSALRQELEAKQKQLEQLQRQLEAERAGAVKDLEEEKKRLIEAHGEFTSAEAEITRRRAALEEETARLAAARREIDADRNRVAALLRSLEIGAKTAPVAPAAAAPASAQAAAASAPAGGSAPAAPKAAAPAKPAPAPKVAAAPKTAVAAKPAAATKSGPPKPAPAAGEIPQPTETASIVRPDRDAAEKYREKIAGWAEAAARALNCKDGEVVDIREAALLYDPEGSADLGTARPAVATILRHRGEHWNGHGGPDGLAEQAIPLGARILAVAVAYAEMVIGTPDTPMLYYLDAKAALKRGAGTTFDPDIVKAFCRVVSRA